MLEFIENNPKQDLEDMIALYEEKTKTTLYPAQDAMILLHIFAYYLSLVKAKFNDSANLNLVRKSRAPFLDFLGEMKKCTRLENEEDEDYIERILLAPEGFSVAGPEGAYSYFAKSAHPDIADVSVDCPSDDITLEYNDEKITLDNAAKDNEVVLECEFFDIKANYQKSTVELALKEDLKAGDLLKITIPNPYEIMLYILGKEGSVSNEVLDEVKSALKSVSPLCDKKNIQSAQIQEFVISGKVYIKKNADLNTLQKSVKEALEKFLEKFQNTLDIAVVKNQIESCVLNIEGVFDFELTSPQNNLSAQKGVSYRGSLGEIEYERVEDEK